MFDGLAVGVRCVVLVNQGNIIYKNGSVFQACDFCECRERFGAGNLLTPRERVRVSSSQSHYRRSYRGESDMNENQAVVTCSLESP